MALQRSNFSYVGWALPPGAKQNTRPFKLLTELQKVGFASDSLDHYFHGRSASVGKFHNAGALLPIIKGETTSGFGALLSPVFIPSLQPSTIKWVDVYDDWGLAPDINPVHRMLSRNTYNWLRKNYRDRKIIVTCNSRYMAGKLGLSESSIIPNGVDEYLSNIPRKGGDQKRLILLGHFFPGRTDFDLIKTIAAAKIFDEIVVGGPGESLEMREALEVCRAHAKVDVHDWISSEKLCDVAGANTVALVPNIVSDYTLSQDLMKVYQFIALGLRVICPMPLWPARVPIQHAFLYGHGARLVPNLNDWVQSGQITDEERRSFAAEHSWRRRAIELAEKLG